MADRIVYLVDKLPRGAGDGPLEFVDDAGLSSLMAEGFEVVSTMPERKVQAGGKSVKASMIVLRPAGENRGVSVRGREAEERAGTQLVVVHDEYGRKLSISPAQAMVRELSRGLARLGSAGHLGPAGDHSIPGMTVISSELVSKAQDAGGLAAARGEPKSANPFPAGSEAYMVWRRGWENVKRQGALPVSPEALKSADETGYAMAQDLGPDDVAHCPYPKGSPQHTAWLDGFKRGGGRVE